MSLHVVVGAGPVGSATARRLADRGENVKLISRRGRGPEHPAIERVAADATDAARLATLAAGAAALYNCANPEYTRWFSDWPPIASALLATAERVGAVLASASNLYGYGPVPGPITEDTPLAAIQPKLRLRADMWRDALALHQARRIRATEVRGSDYIEANSIFAVAVAGPVRAGKRAFVPSPLDVPHTWTSIADVAQALVTVARDERAWGRAWLVPSNPPLTLRELARRFAVVTGSRAPRLTRVPYPALWTAGLFVPLLRELRATYYQFARPFVVDSSATERAFALEPTELDAALRSAARPDAG